MFQLVAEKGWDEEGGKSFLELTNLLIFVISITNVQVLT